MIMNIYRKINRRKIQFDFVVNDTKEEYSFEQEIRDLGGRIFRIPRYKVTNHTRYKKSWNALIRDHPEWDMIHCHYITPAVAYLPVMKANNLPVILHSHTSGSASAFKSQLQTILRYPVRNSRVYYFACSQDAAKWMFGNKEALIMKNAIDPDQFVYNAGIRHRLRKKMGLEASFVIGHTGRFEKVKNHSFLIDIFHAVYKKNNKAVLLLIGDGELKNEIEKKVTRLGLQQAVIFSGIRSDVSDLLQVMDAFVFPSLYEGLGIALIEAQAAGLPGYTSQGGVSVEAKITDLLSYLSLQSPAEVWAEAILAGNEKFERTNRYEDVVNAGYAIKDNVRWIEQFYLNNIVKEPVGIEIPLFSNEISGN